MARSERRVGRHLMSCRYAPLLERDVGRHFPWRTVVRWATLFLLLAMSLVPGARVQGLVYVIVFICLLYFEQVIALDCTRLHLTPLL